MATFLVERYWPGVTIDAARAVSEAVEAAAAGTPARVVETILAASDEVCFWYVEAVSAGAVEAAFAAASIPIDRVAQATAFDGRRTGSRKTSSRTTASDGSATP